MRIINRTTGRETTMDNALHVVTSTDPDAMRLLLARLLEELTSDLHGNPVLTDGQLQRVLEYAFKVERV